MLRNNRLLKVVQNVRRLFQIQVKFEWRTGIFCSIDDESVPDRAKLTLPFIFVRLEAVLLKNNRNTS